MQTTLSWGKRHPLLLGLGLIFVFTWAIDLTLAAQRWAFLPPLLPEWLGLLVGYVFVLATVIATWVSDGPVGLSALLHRYIIWRVSLRWYAVALVGPVVIVLLAIGLAMLSGAPMPDFNRPFVRLVAGVPAAWSLGWIALGWLLFEIFTNGEEIGWRGYVLPRLQERYTPLIATLLLGLIWALWHLPKFGMGGAQELARAYPFWLFSLDILAQALLFTWLYNHTRGSLLLATLFHASHNTALMCLPIGMAVPGGALPFFIAIVLRCLWAALVIFIAGPNLGRQVSTPITPPHHGTLVSQRIAR